MASLVKKHQDSPFHLIYGDNQRIGKDKMMEYMKTKGFSDSLSNFTLSQSPNHPKTKDIENVPYYLVFDHTGKLRYEHMCGQYHGGDGMKCVEWVDKLVKEIPAIYFGTDKFEHYEDLVKKLETGENLSKGVKKVETAQSEAENGSEEAVELDRIYSVLTKYRDKELNKIEQLRATEPAKVLGELKDLKAQFKGTALCKSVTDRYEELSKSDEHKAEKKIADTLNKYKKKLDGASAKQKAKTIKQAAKALRKQISKNPTLPICSTAEAWLTANGAPEE